MNLNQNLKKNLMMILLSILSNKKEKYKCEGTDE